MAVRAWQLKACFRWVAVMCLWQTSLPRNRGAFTRARTTLWRGLLNQRGYARDMTSRFKDTAVIPKCLISSWRRESQAEGTKSTTRAGHYWACNQEPLGQVAAAQPYSRGTGTKEGHEWSPQPRCAAPRRCYPSAQPRLSSRRRLPAIIQTY